MNPDHLYVGTHKDNARDRDEAGHTSRWEHRYNFKRSGELVAKIKECLKNGLNVQEVCNELGIGRQTLYRTRAQDTELMALYKATKSARYSKGARKR